MNKADLPTEDQMVRLKQELNFLLWTSDVPEVPADFPKVIAPVAQSDQAKVNIQCTGHAIVGAGIFMRRGFRVTTRAGMAFVLEASPEGNRDKDLLNQIGKHWWFSLHDHGLVDLSLNGEHENPLIYCNLSPGGRWQVAFGDDRQKLDGFLKARQQGCFYLTLKKQRVTTADLTQSLSQEFPPAKRAGIALSYGKILDHCEELVAGAGASLMGQPQTEAWRKFAG